MLISDTLKCVFIHIAKTGGSSVEKVLKKYDKKIRDIKIAPRGRHMFLRDLKEAGGEDFDDSRYNDYFKFAFVRNPYERLLSGYLMCQQFPLAPEEYCVRRYSFHEFIAQKIFTNMIIATKQTDYILEDGICIVDFVGRYENLKKDFKKVAAQLGIPSALPHINATMHKHYSAYYNEKTKDIVMQFFQEDIDYFGYQFRENDSSHFTAIGLGQSIDYLRRRLQSSTKQNFPEIYSILKKIKEKIGTKQQTGKTL